MRLIRIMTRSTETAMSDSLLEVRGLKVGFTLREGKVQAVDGITFQIPRGRVLGLVGESGCGKTVASKSLMRIEHPAVIEAGEILFHRTPSETVTVQQLDPTGQEVRALRWNEIAMIFQEPMTSFGPMHTIGSQIEEALMLHQDVSRKVATEKAIEALISVGMPRPAIVMKQYPHQLSGGMRQRAMIAMALCCHPSLLIADEPTTALDVTTEAQILELLKERQQALGMSILYITHNLAVIAQIADEIIVMYLGRIVEHSDVETLFLTPKHPYTRALLGSIPRVDQDPEGRLVAIEGTVPDPYTRPSGCPFHPRCPDCMPGLCDVKEPPNISLADGTTVNCFLYSEAELVTR
ncbi:MAG: ABC transporter ATP-binding protein [Chloroflexi bacterium]|nr:ABC transporter ATP-binding protein [Chloroflexota bacterium]